MVTSNPIDKVSPVARTEERKHRGRMGREKGPRATRACVPTHPNPIQAPGLPCLAPIQASRLLPSSPGQVLSSSTTLPWQRPSPTSPAFWLQGPKAPDLEQPRTRMKLAQWVCLIHVRAGEKGHILRSCRPLWHWTPVQSPEGSPCEEGHIPALRVCCDRAKSREKSKME